MIILSGDCASAFAAATLAPQSRLAKFFFSLAIWGVVPGWTSGTEDRVAFSFSGVARAEAVSVELEPEFFNFFFSFSSSRFRLSSSRFFCSSSRAF